MGYDEFDQVVKPTDQTNWSSYFQLVSNLLFGEDLNHGKP
jgi:hypothetical protein